MNLRQRILGATIAAFIACSAAAAFPMMTMAATGLTIQPIKISETLKPGDTATGQILLSNASADDTIVDITVQDFVPTSGTESFQFVGRAPGVTSVRDWISIDAPIQFVFKPGESKEISYTIKAPADAEPGSHFGVIFFKATRAADKNLQMKVGTQVGVLTFVTIPGKFEQKGGITGFTAPSFVQGGPINLSMEFTNTGTVYFEPKGTIEITNMFGSKIASVPIGGYAVLPTGVKKMDFTWNVSGLILGRYKATANIFDTDGNIIASASTSFFALPIWYLVGFIVLLVIIFFVIWFLKTKVSFNVKLKK
jgi:hypothetical protein